MRVTATDDQDECHEILNTLGIREAFERPPIGGGIRDGISPLGENTWLIVTYRQQQNRYIIHIVEDASLEEATKFFNDNRSNIPHHNPQLTLVRHSL